ncbi:helix-turn-helix transcriptional regulator [Antricoccus suffuscus]|uniref:helix-turn-helix transcriptional regulator n=1 Tax=Antricoccus suffuscus TaxID=1629062 RepID=UPI00192DCF59|nr:helix-turn-helix transcriptional regulator [Antricoccus suffuscus]
MPRWGSDIPIVGRATEVARLMSALERAAAGEATAVLLAGDAGVGKTRVLREVTEKARNHEFVVAYGYCMDVGEVGMPYLPFSDLLNSLADSGDHDDVFAEHQVVRRLLRGGGPGLDQTSRLQLFDAVIALCAAISRKRPLLLVIEDLHWADQSTRELLRFLLSRIRDEHIAVVASYRSDDLHRRHPLRATLGELVRLPAVERMQLDPLPDPSVSRLIRALQPHTMPAPVVRRIVQQSEGNPFYAEELLAAALERPDDASIHNGLPSALADLLVTRFEQLTPEGQQVIRVASVAGRRVEHSLLRDAVSLPTDQLDAGLRDAIGNYILEPAGDGQAYTFRHALLQEASYGDLLPGERARVHAVYAELLSADADPARSAAARAHHYLASHDLPDALTASLEAADHAAHVGAPGEVLHHLETVLEIWSAVPDAEARVGHSDIVVLLRASNAATECGDANRAVALTRAALDKATAATDADLTAQIRYTLAKNLVQVDRDQAAYEQSKAALELIPATPPSATRVWAAATHVLTAHYVGAEQEALKAGQEGLRAAESLGILDAQSDLIVSLLCLAPVGRDTDDGLAQLTYALELARRSGNVAVELRTIFNLAIGRYEGGDMESALLWTAAGIVRAHETGMSASPYPTQMLLIQSLAQHVSGDWDAMCAERDQPLHVRALGLQVDVARGVSIDDELARIFSTTPAELLQQAQSPNARTVLWSIDAAINAGPAAIDQATWAADAVAAIEWYERIKAVLDVVLRPNYLVGVRLSALALTAAADQFERERIMDNAAGMKRWRATADKLIESARQTMRHHLSGASSPHLDGAYAVGPEARAWVARADAEYSRLDAVDSVSSWRHALESFDYGDVYERARCEWRLAEALIAAGERHEADQHIKSARETAQRLNARPLVSALDAIARRARLRSAGAADTRDSLLTAREHDVLSLLAKGRTNRQIGKELFISDKTASVHVSKILAKLGAASRTEAAAIARQRGYL